MAPASPAALTSSSRAKVPARLASSTITSWPRWRRHGPSRPRPRRAWRERPIVPRSMGRRAELAAAGPRSWPALGLPAVLVEPLGRVLGVDAELVGQHLGRGRRGGQAEHRARAVLGFPHGPQPGHGGRLARPGRADQDVERAPRGRDLLDGQRLVEARARDVPAGQVGLGHGGHRGRGGGRTVHLAPGIEQAGLGVEQCRGGVDLVALGPEPAASRRPGAGARACGAARAPRSTATGPERGQPCARPRRSARRARRNGRRAAGGAPRPRR